MVRCSEVEIQRHLKCHGFAEFQCLYCVNHFDDAKRMQMHMSIDHSSHFLFVGIRQSSQYVYIGDLCDYSARFKFYACTNEKAMNRMNPKLYAIEQHRTEQQWWNFNQTSFMSEIDVTKVPTFSLERTMEDFFNNDVTILSYTEYQSAKGANGIPKTTFKCVSSHAANEIRSMNLGNIENSVYTNLVCNCSKNDRILDDLKPYLDHLTECSPNGCHVTTDRDEQMIEHRIKKHDNLPIEYIEVNADVKSGLEVQKLVKCTFQCNIESCPDQFHTKLAVEQHFRSKHPDCTIGVRLMQKCLVIHSNDPKQKVATTINRIVGFRLCQCFYCNHNDHLKNGNKVRTFVGTKSDAMLHHQEEHGEWTSFEVLLHKHLLSTKEATFMTFMNRSEVENVHPFRMHVIECLNCTLFFDSFDSLRRHHEVAKHQNVMQFMPRKLVKCMHCNSMCISKFMTLHHNEKHPNVKTATNNVLCNICQTSEFVERFSNEQLQRFHGIDRIEIENCAYSPSCCNHLKFNDILELILHSISCLSFNCGECSECSGNLHQIIEHYRNQHNKSDDEIIKEIHNFKHLSGALLNIHIIFPAGLVMTRRSINGTTFDGMLQNAIAQNIMQHILPTISYFVRISTKTENTMFDILKECFKMTQSA